MGEAQVSINQAWREKNSKTVWCLSIPGVPTRHKAYANFFNSLDLRYIDFFCKVEVPSFKLVPYDTLINVLKQLNALNKECDKLFFRTEERLVEVVPKGPRLFTAYSIQEVPLHEYIKTFTWDAKKFPHNMSVTDVSTRLVEDTGDLQAQFLFFSTARRDAVMALEAYQRKSLGTVTTRDINHIIPDESYVVESKNLTTLFVAVPKHLSKLWSETYEHITNHIIPDSSKLMASDNDFDLYNLVVWKRGSEAFREYISSETELSFRPFLFNITEFRRSKGVEERLHKNEKSSTERLSSWIRINMRRVFLHTMHVKLLTLHVESLIKYGIPFRFQIILMQPKKNKAKYLMKDINKKFQYLELKIFKETWKSGALDPEYKTYGFTTIRITDNF